MLYFTQEESTCKFHLGLIFSSTKLANILLFLFIPWKSEFPRTYTCWGHQWGSCSVEVWNYMMLIPISFLGLVTREQSFYCGHFWTTVTLVHRLQHMRHLKNICWITTVVAIFMRTYNKGPWCPQRCLVEGSKMSLNLLCFLARNYGEWVARRGRT